MQYKFTPNENTIQYKPFMRDSKKRIPIVEERKEVEQDTKLNSDVEDDIKQKGAFHYLDSHIAWLFFNITPLVIHTTLFILNITQTALPLIVASVFLTLTIFKIVVEKIESNAIKKFLDGNTYLDGNTHDATSAELLHKTLSRCSFAHGIYKIFYTLAFISSFGLVSMQHYQNTVATAGSIVNTSITGVIDGINLSLVGSYIKNAKEESLKSLSKELLNNIKAQEACNTRSASTSDLIDNSNAENFNAESFRGHFWSKGYYRDQQKARLTFVVKLLKERKHQEPQAKSLPHS